MPDLQLTWAGDLSISSTGDLAIIDDPVLGTERVLRRLMTNTGDYIWNPNYGAGLAQFVGRPVDAASLESLIRAQMKLESAVSQILEPVISISPDVAGGLYLQVRYEDSSSSMSSVVSASIAG